MLYSFYAPGRAPIQVEGTCLTPHYERVARPVPRVGEKVVLDGDDYLVTDVKHIVQLVGEVRIYVQLVG